jgi:4-amino-4-deoxy-L-arabinose transferase-like glycosyltransferase
MFPVPPFRLTHLLLLLVVLAAAAGARAWYLTACVEDAAGRAPLHAQDAPPRVRVAGEGEPFGKKDANELDNLVFNLREYRWFGCLAPLADKEEKTAHVAPGYPYMLSFTQEWVDDWMVVVRWAQCALGALTAGLYFLFARRAFGSVLVASLTGLLCAIHPFWVVNTAEINDGVLATFLLAASLFLGTRAGQEGDAVSSLLFGLALSGLTLVRASLLPFALVALLWFLLRCRKIRRGWLCALLAFLGLANGVALWGVRNWRTFNEVVPIADSAFLHLYEGNNRLADGGPQSEKKLEEALGTERLQTLRNESNQSKRYNMLAHDVLDEIQERPATTVRRRIAAAQYFLLGKAWFSDTNPSQTGRSPGRTPAASSELPEWLTDLYPLLIQASLLAMLTLGLLGWRWTHAWRRQVRLATLAALWIPLPYMLSHGENLWGPRLPLDGVLLCYAAFALIGVIPGVGHRLLVGPKMIVEGPPRREVAMPSRRL